MIVIPMCNVLTGFFGGEIPINLILFTNIVNATLYIFIVELLLQHKADVSIIDNSQNTALHYACMHVSGTGKHRNGWENTV